MAVGKVPVGRVESWRPIVGYEGTYEVSDCGRVRSLDRIEPGRANPDGTIRMRRRASRIRKLAENVRGYIHLVLSQDGVSENRTVHSLVLEAFVGPRPDGLVARHMDGDPGNNSIENLKWGTQTDNQFDTIRHGRNPRINNDSCPQGHPYSGRNLRLYISGVNTTRACRACQMAYKRVKARRAAGEDVALSAVADVLYEEFFKDPA